MQVKKMKIKVDDFLTATWLGKATESEPAHAIVQEVNFIEAAKLPFASKKDKYEITIEIDGETTKWLANKTSLRSLAKAFGTDAENWIGKQIKLWAKDQLVQGDVKSVIYASA